MDKNMEKNRRNVEVPEDGQPLGKDYPPEQSDVRGEPGRQLVEGSNAYENMGGGTDETGADGGAVGPFSVPDDDLAGEGWVPPMVPGGGWVHPLDLSLEERLEETEGIEDEPES